ncbi:MAG: WYL domain-containing protein [Actinomycetota bacterium]|nr:WYL domain-containing protein [Actinomycetota bacterium]
MSAIKPEPLALEVALAHYVASLPEGKRVPLEEISRDFGYPVKEIRAALEAVLEVEDRDLTTISGVAVEDGKLVKYSGGGYERGFRRTVRLSPVQARAALLALDLVRKAADPGILGSLRNKVRGAFGEEEVFEVEVGRVFDEDIPVVAAVDGARRERRLLEIRYPSGKEIRTRTVEPLLVSGIEGAWYLNAYCRDAEAPRLFRLERILSARMLEERFEERDGVELRTEYEDIDPRGYAARRAVVRFSPEVARWMEEKPELDLLERREDGSADYALYYTDEAWAARRVMQYLGEAVVVEPEGLRKEIHRQAATLLEAYREEGS